MLLEYRIQTASKLPGNLIGIVPRQSALGQGKGQGFESHPNNMHVLLKDSGNVLSGKHTLLKIINSNNVSMPGVQPEKRAISFPYRNNISGP